MLALLVLKEIFVRWKKLFKLFLSTTFCEVFHRTREFIELFLLRQGKILISFHAVLGLNAEFFQPERLFAS